ncbi:helicase sen1 isoform X2 [Manihot esculenta]|uniref:helicase sen1 isoform X2 n=1 Tax=Manihot esculenta TaxID=3983 RepID=UPI000B5D718D|nr:helicase sen1 isoform X2 [Manihot esculenta]
MGSRGRPLFDLNEPPAEDDEETDRVICLQPQKALPSVNPNSSDLLAASVVPLGIKCSNAFSHASSVSGFQPFVRPKVVHSPEEASEQKKMGDENPNFVSSLKTSNGDGTRAASSLVSGSADPGAVEREEGEWSDVEGSAGASAGNSLHVLGKASKDQGKSELICSASDTAIKDISGSTKVTDYNRFEISGRASHGMDQCLNDQKSNSIQNSDSNANGDASMDGQEDTAFVPKAREVKGVEANHALKYANHMGKRKIDQHKEAMLGKKRNRQTMLINIDEVKQAGPIKSSTPRRQPTTIRTVKEVRSVPPPAEHGEKHNQPMFKDHKQVGLSCNEGGTAAEFCQPKSECNGDISSGHQAKPRRLNNDSDFSGEAHLPPIPRQISWKQPADLRRQRRNPVLMSQSSMESKMGNKKNLPAKKPALISTPYQDTSVERLIREVTNEKFWHHPEESELQCIPGRFESVEEYVKVFEPLLFEECRAQLYSTWEELTETNTHVMVRVKSIERRERGWYDVIVLPVSECKWTFKEGDVAVLSTPRPGTVRTKRSNTSSYEDDDEPEISGRVAGTVRRHIPFDTRDPHGAILHFFVGDSYDPYSKADEDHILRKLQPRCTWYLTVLGSLATTQREYVALHAFCRLNSQMQTAILKPSPDHFPKYEQQTPAMPECFTQNFVDHLHRTFNGPQLAAIQWAAMHTAAGTSSGMTKRQDPWPFTLVQGPPGTGKTHTVWGMLNVIHLVQYQHYYTSLLKKLAPQSYKQADESNSGNIAMGSIDEVLHNMDQNIFRSLSKLCPKPRMLVCAPSNAATDELLARVLDRGFIDGEMKVYRPDVARVGVDSQSRAAQAVSVERRTEQLLVKSREEVSKWMQDLRGQEAYFSGQIADLQNKLSMAAADGRSQGSVGVDPDILMARDQNRDALLQNLAAAVENRDKVLVEISRLLILEARFRGGSNFNLEEARASLEASFANEAEIVFTTVSSSGRKLFARLTHGFDMVVIDEAAQASEVAVLPPLALGAARCVLVGDPQQLPATVISKAAGTLMYSRSLFERFQQAGCPTMLLSVQYRMHPQIRDFPSRHFYQGRLTDSESVVNLPEEMYYKDPLLRPYLFYDVTYGRESHRGGSVSYQNIHEAQLCVQLYEHLQKTLKSFGLGRISVGIITPYKLQLKCLQHEFSAILKSEEGKDIYINTVDAFQGQERDVIIMSCVRASNHGVGFVADIRRMNVALTRAKRALWVMGNANSLVQSDDWAALINDAKARSCYMDMDSLPKEFFVSKGMQGKSTNTRGLRIGGPRHRSMDIHVESRSGTPSEDDDSSSATVISRNGSYRPFKPLMDNSLDDFDHLGDKSRDAWQYGVQKKPSSSGIKRDS